MSLLRSSYGHAPPSSSPPSLLNLTTLAQCQIIAQLRAVKEELNTIRVNRKINVRRHYEQEEDWINEGWRVVEAQLRPFDKYQLLYKVSPRASSAANVNLRLRDSGGGKVWTPFCTYVIANSFARIYKILNGSLMGRNGAKAQQNRCNL